MIKVSGKDKDTVAEMIAAGTLWCRGCYGKKLRLVESGNFKLRLRCDECDATSFVDRP